MDCFYFLCLFRQNKTANPDNCDYLACKNRCEGTFAFSADCCILDAEKLQRLPIIPIMALGLDVRR